MTTDIDKTKKTLEDGLVILKDFQKQNKLTVLGYVIFAIKHARKLIRVIKNIKEISLEVKDLDGTEAKELTLLVAESFDTNQKVREGVVLISEGAGKINQGVQILIKKS